MIRQILALNCLLQIEQVDSEDDESNGDLLALEFLFSLASQPSAPFLIRLCHFARSDAICSQDSGVC